MYCKCKGNVKPCLNGYNTLYYLHKSQYLPNRVMIRVTSKSVPSTSQDRVFLLNFISCFDRCLTD